MVGSSPRVRGKGEVLGPREGPEGIIPAGAGKRTLKKTSKRKCGDHPRGCGEKLCGLA